MTNRQGQPQRGRMSLLPALHCFYLPTSRGVRQTRVATFGSLLAEHFSKNFHLLSSHPTPKPCSPPVMACTLENACIHGLRRPLSLGIRVMSVGLSCLYCSSIINIPIHPRLASRFANHTRNPMTLSQMFACVQRFYGSQTRHY